MTTAQSIAAITAPQSNAAAASYWLAKGANVNTQDQQGAVGLPGRSPLHMCAHFGDTETIDLLLQLGADPNATDDQGRTPLFFTNFAKAAETLLRAGANVKHQDDNGATALEARIAAGWHVDEPLRAALNSKEVPSSNENENGDVVRNLEGEGTARVWDIHFHVAETHGHASGSEFTGTLGSSPHSELTDGEMKITLGDVLIVLKKSPGRLMTLRVNGRPYGTVEPQDEVSIDAERRVRVNGTGRVAGDVDQQ